MFSVHENERSTFSNSSCLKNIVEKLSLRDGLVWTVGLTIFRPSAEATLQSIGL